MTQLENNAACLTKLSKLGYDNSVEDFKPILDDQYGIECS
jgi:hypothetical protein